VRHSLHKIFQFLYGPIFWVLDFFMRHYKLNRERFEKLISKKRVASFIRGAAVLLLFVWIVTFYLASDASRNQLTLEMKQSFSDLKSDFEK
jgi:hypothetical protein